MAFTFPGSISLSAHASKLFSCQFVFSSLVYAASSQFGTEQSENFIKVQLSPFSRSSVQMLNKTECTAKLYGTPLETTAHFDKFPLPLQAVEDLKDLKCMCFLLEKLATWRLVVFSPTQCFHTSPGSQTLAAKSANLCTWEFHLLKTHLKSQLYPTPPRFWVFLLLPTLGPAYTQHQNHYRQCCYTCSVCWGVLYHSGSYEIWV